MIQLRSFRGQWEPERELAKVTGRHLFGDAETQFFKKLSYASLDFD